MRYRGLCGIALLFALAVRPAFAHHGPSVLTTVQIMESVMVGETPLQPGTYEIRLTGEHLKPLPGQSEESEVVVEFVKDGVVVAHDGAEVVPGDARPVGTSGGSAPRARVERLKGDEFLRISVNKGAERYLIHLPLTH